MPEEDSQDHGLVASCRRLAQLTLAIFENRVALFAIELSAEKIRAAEALFWGAAFFFLALLAAVVLTIVVVWASPQAIRLWVLAGFGLAYLAGAAGVFITLRNRLQNWPPPFSDTMAEIKKDRECLLEKK